MLLWAGDGFHGSLLAQTQPSPSGTQVPPQSAIIDNSLDVWTIGGDTSILRNGVQVSEGYGTIMAWIDGTVYVYGADVWWDWTGTRWEYFSRTAPAGVTAASTTSDYIVNPGQNIQSTIDSAPEGAVILLRAGVHRGQTLTPKNGQTLAGEPGSVLSGARLLTSFAQNGTAWVASGQTQQGAAVGQCQDTAPRCNRPEELFFDNVRLRHVSSPSNGAPGRWYFDYASDSIWIWNDPSGHRVETSVVPVAITGNATGVTIRDLTIEKFASPGQDAAISGTGPGWLVQGNLVRWNHGIGIGMAQERRVIGNTVTANGEMGIGGGSSDALVEGNEIAYNNAAGYNPYWEGGGTKFSASSNLTIRGNYVHDNYGPGLHSDGNNINLLIENNRVEDNDLSGIFHEVAYHAVIRNNSIARNGRTSPDPYWVDGAGILISGSPDVEVYGNTLVDNFQGITALNNKYRGSGAYGPFVLKNLYVHDNVITQTRAAAGMARTGVSDIDSTDAFTSLNNRFERNTYHLAPGAPHFFWMDSNLDEYGWRGYGQDVTGTFTN